MQNMFEGQINPRCTPYAPLSCGTEMKYPLKVLLKFQPYLPISVMDVLYQYLPIGAVAMTGRDSNSSLPCSTVIIGRSLCQKQSS